VGWWYQWEEGGGGKDVEEWKLCKYFVQVYINRKMIPFETIPGIGGIENDGGGEFKYDII
jgi:hypothetical protein